MSVIKKLFDLSVKLKVGPTFFKNFKVVQQLPLLHAVILYCHQLECQLMIYIYLVLVHR